MRAHVRMIILAAFIGSLSTIAWGQQAVDTQLWTGGTLKLRVSDKLRTHVEEQVRFTDTISTLGATFTELGFQYNLGKHFAIGSDLRYYAMPLGHDRARVAVNLHNKWRKNSFPLSVHYRMRFQHTTEPGTGKASSYLRNKLGLGYNLSHIVDPLVEFESYFRFNGKNEFRRNRFTFGLEWRISKRIDLVTYYRIQNEFNKKEPERERIYAVLLAYDLDLRRPQANPGPGKADIGARRIDARTR